MSANILSPVQRGKARFLEEVIEAWEREPVSAQMVQDLEELIRVCEALPSDWQRTWNDMLQRCARPDAEHVYTAVEQVRQHFEAVWQRVQSVCQLCDAAERSGFPVVNAGDLRRTLTELSALREAAFRHWHAPPTATEVEAHRAAHARGESLALEDAFAQAAGVDLEQWRRRVEAHQPQRGRS